ncbi:radical S-adenosyl methionine domain-containing protein 1 [Mortierella polycephala]|uniref:Radical S-adenosyl methionine domain-containing protein 1 n=1 Tax=Mortierella polycephala TaxID=41804 RepID=A0A9P6QCE6_9FUNG|nr:radical S-adenosyl methionine domain-containing protein 1 [Mortierella polycephala]
MYEAMIQITGEAGFEHYEVSNFARNQAYSMHNSGHWLGIAYLGKQLEIRDPAGWMRQCEEQGAGRTMVVNEEETKQELVVLGMRTKRGIELERFKRLTNQDLLAYVDADALQASVAAGLVILSPTRLSPTERGMAVADELVARLIP